jgi:lipopolysaccharide export system ATP-binding protein
MGEDEFGLTPRGRDDYLFPTLPLDRQPAMALLEADHLVKTFRRRRVVDDISFYVDPGEIVGLIGPNGAGKTTTFRMAAGMIRPDSGRILFDGRDVTAWPLHRRARNCRLGYLAQEPSIFGKLTVRDNLFGVMKLLGHDRDESRRRSDELLEQFGLTKLAEYLAGGLSGGERRRLEIARTLLINPRLIMLDEPFAGIDPVTVDDIRAMIAELRDRGISILITDHQVRETLQTVDRCYVVRTGKVLVHGDARTVLEDPVAREHYFGEGAYLDAAANLGPRAA